MAFNKKLIDRANILQEEPAIPPTASAENEHELPTDTVTSKAASRKPKK